uniref:Protein Red-like n=1 Tax=Dermatophagoides pteronyssinus TaxID=6956 RepID=A0A6P6YGI7_DERPT|nr:protein Red-like [Dermatophagoides pteronyssinus]
MDNEPFSNPLAPPSALPSKTENHAVERSQPLTNDDFRKLMMTPRSVMHGQSATPGSVRGSIRNKHGRSGYKPKVEQSENIKKKKKIYEMIRKQDGDVLNELAKKYRDRAKERRDGSNMDAARNSDILTNSTAYHAVGPDNFDMDATERRKQLIQKSKYLGGDMEHTHLVKGLDYALLQKVKAEIQTKEDEDEYLREQQQQEEEARKEEERQQMKKYSKKDSSTFDDQDRYAIKNKKVENLLKIIFNENLPEKNELFRQGRMAYQYDLTNDFPENEIPTTIIRSKAECPNLDAYNSISTNEIIMNKLIQIWTHIRQGSSKKQRRKFESLPSSSRNESSIKQDKTKYQDDNIYDDVGDYIPDIKTKRVSSSTRENNDGKRKSYFESTKKLNKYEDHESGSSKQAALEMAASVVGNLAASNMNTAIPKIKKAKLQQEPESYAECYPGYAENDDAIIDTDDDDDDNDKVVKGKNRQSHNRFEYNDDDDDGDNEEKEMKYGNSSKSSNANKTKRMKDEKAKLDREYQKINALINKKKQSGEKIGMSYISEPKI